MIHILLVEDDPNISNTISYYLQANGFTIQTTKTVEEGIEKIKNNSYELMLLDINLPDGTGYELYKRMRDIQKIPTIFLTALDEEKDIVKGFDLGADDYITKPFHAGELLSRIKNVLRHTSSSKEKLEDKIKIQNVELKILVMLFENKGKMITREQILSYIWDNEENFVNDNTLTVYIKRIREKIEDNPTKPEIIKTVRGLGYKIEQ